MELTAHGEALVQRGRELLALNDEILRSLHAQPQHAAVRLGFDEWLHYRGVQKRAATTTGTYFAAGGSSSPPPPLL
jgi:DNA-binding transcriptional LysR family regulator